MVYISTNVIVAKVMKNIKDIFVFCIFACPNFPQTKRGANGGFLPKPLLLRLRHPNSKTNEPKFWQILSPKNCFAKTSSALFRRGSARQWRNDSFIIRILLKIHSNFVQNIPPENEIGFGCKNMVGTKCRLF